MPPPFNQNGTHTNQMELTIDQALQQGVAAHKEGKLQDAERLYRAILQAQPQHPDANHNLAVLAVSVGKIVEALPLFTKAIEMSPETDQYWLSYVQALIEVKQYEQAQQQITSATASGLDPSTFNVLQKIIDKAQGENRQLPSSKLRPNEQPPDLREKIKNDKRSDVKRVIKDSKRMLEHYKAGRVTAAERLAISLTQDFPEYDVGFRVLGAIRHAQGKYTDAASAYQKTIELCPKDAAAHFDLAVSLQTDGKLLEAKKSYGEALALQHHYPEARNNLGLVLKGLGNLESAEANFRIAVIDKPDYARGHYNLACTLKELGKSEEAEQSLRQALTIKNDYAAALFALGNLLHERHAWEKARDAFVDLILLEPDHYSAHINLGNTLLELDQKKEAAARYSEAILLNPGALEGHYNLGKLHHSAGRWRQAEASYRRAISLDPESDAAHNDLASTLLELGHTSVAIEHYGKAISLKPDEKSYYFNLGQTLSGIEFTSFSSKLYPLLENLLLIGDCVRPEAIANAICSLVKLDPVMVELFRVQAISGNHSSIDLILNQLKELPILYCLMTSSVLPDLELEKFFTAIRKVLLEEIETLKESSGLVACLSALSVQCLVNEYVYLETLGEEALVERLEHKIADQISQSLCPAMSEILLLASYRPLHHYDWCNQIESLNSVPDVKARLIDQPLTEKALKRSITAITDVTDVISQEVQDQYEENPYPRWVQALTAPERVTLQEWAKASGHNIDFGALPRNTGLEILIAGCGTGIHPIEVASRYVDCEILAVDLSRTSLAYAQRTADEMGIENISFRLADILRLDQLDSLFDIIESVGVLHHTGNPFESWQVLTRLLKPGGMMKIGLYSELARAHIVEIRQEIKSQGLGTSADHIKNFRQSLIQSTETHHQLLSHSVDFFSVSALRDLVFHTQEHRFTVPEIQSHLDGLGLTFCGFELPKNSINEFKQTFGHASDVFDLSLWQRFEEANPSTFAKMYQFWCQKI